MDWKKIETEEYAFLKEESLKSRLMLVAVGGSHAYGLDVDTPEHKSDIDLRGAIFHIRDELLLMREPSQFIDNKTDTVLYEFNKFVRLLLQCNPNVIEILGCRKEDYYYIHPLGQMILDQRDAFLSKRCLHSFGGYAMQQLSRLENAIVRNGVSQEKQEAHILRSMESAMLSMNGRYQDFGEGIRLYLGQSKKKDMDTEILMDLNLKGYPLRDFTGALNELTSIQKTYHKINHRNRKKDAVHLNKHAAHLMRLYMMLEDLVRDGEIKTYRDGTDHDLLMKIRNGGYMEEDGSYKPEFFSELMERKKRMEVAIRTTVLPEQPDLERVNRMVREVNEYVFDTGKKGV